MFYKIYHDTIPPYLLEIMNTNIFTRLKDIGMNCGMEYTQFQTFKNSFGVSRYDYSIGVSLITYHFTHDKHATVAALLHDIATPVFAHVIDFLNNDYEKQESTEAETKKMIFNSRELQKIFLKYEIDINLIYDYHKYPIADNESPKLSADRLEYTLANAYYYNFLSVEQIKSIYYDLIINDKKDEIIFKSKDKAIMLTKVMFQCSRVYTSDENRYCMEYLANLLKTALTKKLITQDDLYTNESSVIKNICKDKELSDKWEAFCHFHQVDISHNKKAGYYKINAKHRYFNPMIGNQRIINQSPKFKSELNSFLGDHFDRYVKVT